MAELIYNTKKVFGEYLVNNQVYNIPEYQRGYKWTDQQVKQLLNDINDFESGGDEELFYCLQNITIVPNKTTNKLNVVDGQQRLTTISLLLAYLGETSTVEGKLIYEVRQPSNEFIQQVISNEHSFIDEILSSKDFEGFISSSLTRGKDYDFQDIYYMFTAVRAMDTWVKEINNFNKSLFKAKLLQNVKLIINRVENVSEQELFMSLHARRVQLDGSDLVRAILITRVAKQEMEEFDSKEVKDVVRLNERRIRIGWELDEINAWWSKKDVKDYFSNFINIKTGEKETIKFDHIKYPINLLYKIWAESEGNKSIKLRIFEAQNTNALNLYTSIILLHRTLKNWYEDREVYHFLGFLFTHRSINIKDVLQNWNKDISKNEFVTYLKTEIQASVFGKDPKEEGEETGINYWLKKIKDYNDLKSTNWYDTPQLEKILLLLDVLDHSKVRVHGNPLPYLKAQYFKKYKVDKKSKEDKEHIYPGTPKEISDFKIMSDLDEYITKLNSGYDGDKLIHWHYSTDDWNALTEEEKVNQLENLKGEIHKKRPINSIGNLVLLHLSINRGFGNNYYADKRREVINNTGMGFYVRQHTLKVFVKQTQSSDLNSWTMQDIMQNADNIHNLISNFFGIKRGVNHV